MSAGEAVLQLKVSLTGVSQPPVWRRLVVPGTMRLDRLHRVIQTAMGWADYHLHVFLAGGREYGLPDPELDHLDERKTAIGDVIGRPGARMEYVYDFGDHWRHDIVVEKVMPADAAARYPICVAGKGCCPPEDCGGVWGYADLRETLAEPTNDEHSSMLEWLGLETAADFDPEAFDVDDVNALL